MIESIANLIKTKFAKKSGIVYCLSRNECDSTADDLKGNMLPFGEICNICLKKKYYKDTLLQVMAFWPRLTMPG